MLGSKFETRNCLLSTPYCLLFTKLLIAHCFQGLQTLRNRSALLRTAYCLLPTLLAGVALPGPSAGVPQATTSPSTPVRPIGVVTAIQPGQFTLHTDAGADLLILLPDQVPVVGVPPGAKDLKSATKIAASDIAVGDRVLVRGKASDDQKSVTAAAVMVMTKTELASACEAERLEWQRRGIGGPVKAVDLATKQITITVPNTPPTAGNPTHPVTITLAANAVLLRYAPDSVKFSDAKPGTFDEIKVGDQVRALGTKSADGSGFTAEKLVSGTFRNIAATVISVDTQDSTVTVKDLASGTPLVVRTSADSSMHRLPPFLAQMIARLNSGGSPEGATAERPGGGAAGGAPPTGGAGGQRAYGGPGGASGGGPRDFQQMLEHTPSLTLGELKPGDALIAVSTKGAKPSEVTAIILLAGVEPILSARPKGSREVVLPAWNMGAGGAAAEGGP